MAIKLDDRLVPFEACFNFRDLGGYETTDGATVRWGRVYRADTLHRFTAADLDAFGRLGVRTVVDLRAEDEIADHGRLSPDAPDVAWHNHPLIPSMVLRLAEAAAPAGEEVGDQEPGQGYAEFVGDGRGTAGVLERIAASEGPAVFHCTAGKDRTGVIAALLLDLLGVPDETIADDYVLTAQTRKRSAAYIKEHEPAFHAFLARVPLARRTVNPEAILGFLARVRAVHGSPEAMLRSAGLSPGAIGRLRTDLLE